LHLSNGQQQICKVVEHPDSSEFPKCKDDIKYCGNKLCDHGQDFCMTVYKRQTKDAYLQPSFASCIVGKSHPHKEEGKCILRHREDFEIQEMYECVCTGSYCNENIIFPG